MPIYPYACSACGHEFDLLQKVSDDPLTHCPECGEGSLRKKLTAAAFHLKGTGWYETDFKKKEQKGEQKPDAKEAGKEDGKDKTGGKKEEGKTADKKPADKAAGTEAKQSSKSEPKKSDSS